MVAKEKNIRKRLSRQETVVNDSENVGWLSRTGCAIRFKFSQYQKKGADFYKVLIIRPVLNETPRQLLTVGVGIRRLCCQMLRHHLVEAVNIRKEQVYAASVQPQVVIQVVHNGFRGCCV